MVARCEVSERKPTARPTRKRKPRINLALERQIASLTCAGKSQKAISVWLGIPRGKVYRYQKHAGLAARPTPPSPEQVKRLLDRGNGWRKAAAELGCSEHVVRYVAEQNGFRRKARPIPAQLIADILAHKDYGRTLAKQYRVNYKKTLALVHATLDCGPLIPGRTQLPLDSTWPRVKAKEGK